ncbi:MAG: dienelactone hydrolase family protein [Chlorobia bacterium]|nr:dienelactone hydrolase family protein [Fimbriimonadaceae bacterium]
MIGSAVAAFVLFAQTSPNPGRFEMGERLKELDQAWMSTPEKSRRSAAIPKITAAVTSFFSSKAGEACRALDDAIAALEGRSARSADAITLRFEPPFVEPRTPAKLRIGWAYLPVDGKTVRIQVGRQSVVATPGRELVIEVRPEQLNPEILQNPEVGYLMPVQVGSEQRSVFLSIIKRPKERLTALKDSKQPEAKVLVQFLQKVFDDPESLEADVPIIQYLFTAELLDEGRLRLDRADSLPLVKQGNTYFRAAFPRQVRGPLTVVVGLHGAGGSENMFFEAYGRGIAVSEALKRNWAFVSPRASATAMEDVLDWIRTRRKQAVERVFVMGHSMGSGMALRSGSLTPKPSAIALFAPASQNVSAQLREVPLFVSVGKQDLLVGPARSLAQQLLGRKDCVYEELDPCEHLMVVGDSMAGAYRFFDSTIGR